MRVWNSRERADTGTPLRTLTYHACPTGDEPAEDLDRISSELADILDRLNALPADAFQERYELQTRQDQLRDEAAAFRNQLDVERSTNELEAEVASLRKRRDKLIQARIGIVTSKGGSNQGPSSGAMVTLAAKAKDAAQLDPIHARISRLEDVLASCLAERDEPGS